MRTLQRTFQTLPCSWAARSICFWWKLFFPQPFYGPGTSQSSSPFLLFRVRHHKETSPRLTELQKERHFTNWRTSFDFPGPHFFPQFTLSLLVRGLKKSHKGSMSYLLKGKIKPAEPNQCTRCHKYLPGHKA